MDGVDAVGFAKDDLSKLILRPRITGIIAAAVQSLGEPARRASGWRRLVKVDVAAVLVRADALHA